MHKNCFANLDGYGAVSEKVGNTADPAKFIQCF